MTYHNPRHMRHALLLFCPYLAALWFSAWYDLHFYGGSYGTTAADLLLTLALVSALFPPIIAPERNTRLFKIIACAAAAAAVLVFFLCRPAYTVSDGYRILSAADYQNIQVEEQYRPVHGIVYRADRNGQLCEITFDPRNGDFADLV